MRVSKHGCDVSGFARILRIIFKSNSALFSVFTEPHLSTRRVGRILDYVSGLHSCLEFSQASSCLDEAMRHGKSALLL